MENDCRGVALLRLKPEFRNKMAINIITNNIIVFFAIISCGIGMRRSNATPLQSQGRFLWIKLSISYNFQFSIVNYQLSIGSV